MKPINISLLNEKRTNRAPDPFKGSESGLFSNLISNKNVYLEGKMICKFKLYSHCVAVLFQLIISYQNNLYYLSFNRKRPRLSPFNGEGWSCLFLFHFENFFKNTLFILVLIYFEKIKFSFCYLNPLILLQLNPEITIS